MHLTREASLLLWLSKLSLLDRFLFVLFLVLTLTCCWVAVLLSVPGRGLFHTPPDLHQWKALWPWEARFFNLRMGLPGSELYSWILGYVSMLLNELYHAKVCLQLPTKLYSTVSVLAISPAIKWRKKNNLCVAEKKNVLGNLPLRCSIPATAKKVAVNWIFK